MQESKTNNEHPYSTKMIAKSTEKQLTQMLKKFRKEELPWWKFAGFCGYNFFALGGMLLYGYSFKFKRIKTGQKGKIPRSQLTLLNIIKRGSIHGIALGGLYIAGWFIVVPYTLSLQNFQKYNEIESALSAFTVRFDPYYQEYLLYMKMRQFGLSQALIKDVKQDLAKSKTRVIEEGGLSEKSIKVIEDSEAWFKNNFKFNQLQADFVDSNIKQN